MGHAAGVLCLNHGAADESSGIDLFLERIFADRDVIELPLGPRVQARIARVVAARRAPKVRTLYAWMGGGSPLVPYMRAQAAALSDALGGMPVEVGLRYYEPSIGAGLRALVERGVRRIVVLPQYPQYSTTTVGSVLAELERQKYVVPAAAALEYTVVEPFGAHPDYVRAVAGLLRAAAGRCSTAPTLLFSAHSVPLKFVEEGDPYPGEVEAQAAAIAAAAGFADWELAYQSRSGPVRWLGPELEAHVAALLDAGRSDLLVVPLSFVQDHLETLVELDVQLAAHVEAQGGRVTRVRALNSSPALVELWASLVRDCAG